MNLWTFGVILLLVHATWISVSTAKGPDHQEQDDDDIRNDCKILKEEKCHKGEEKPSKEDCEKYIHFNCTADCTLSPRSTVTETSKNYILKTIYVCPTSTVVPTPSVINSRSIPINLNDNPITSTHDNAHLSTKITITPSFPVSSTVEADDVQDDSASEHIPWKDYSSMGILPSFPTITRPTTAPSSSDTSEKDDNDDEETENDKHDDDDADDDDNDDVDVERNNGGDQGNGDSEGSTNEKEDEGGSIIVADDVGGDWGKGYSSYRVHKRSKSTSRSRRASSTKQRPSNTVHVIRSTRIFNTDLATSSEYVLSSTLSSKKRPSDTISGIRATRIFNSDITVAAEHVSASSSKNLRSKTAHVIKDSEMFSSQLRTSKTNILSRTPPMTFTASNSSQSAQPNVTFFSISPSTASSMLHTVIQSTVMTKLDSIGSIMSSRTLFPSTLVAAPVRISLTSSVTPPLSSSVSSESSRILSPTSVVTSSREQSKVNSSLLTSSSNVTLPTSISITPTKSRTVMVTSSFKTQEHTVYCSDSKTGDKFKKGILTWKKTRIDTRANTSCRYNQERLAYRWCRMNMTSMVPYWDTVQDEHCVVLKKNITVDEIRQMNITEENEESLAVLADYITSRSNATVDLVKDGADLLEKLVVEAKNLWKIRKELLNSVSNVMNAPPTVLAQANQKHNSTTKILKFIGQMMEKMSLTGEKVVRENSTNLIAEAWDVANVSYELNFKTNAQEQEKNGASLVSVTLPASLLERYKQKRRITFLNFMNDKLFPQDVDRTKTFINSKIVSVNVKDDVVKNLSDPVVIDFRITNRSFANNCSCVFWDFEANRWSSNGCVYKFIGDGLSRCTCTHLTHFGVLVDLIPEEKIGDTDKLILEGITFVGCYLSIVGLLLTIITLLSFKQYRNGVSGQILLNLCLALLFALVIFLAGIEQVGDESTCVAIAVLLHYFVLVAMLWMGLEAFHMFVNIVLDRLPGELGRVFVLKCAVVAWVVPMLIVVITVLVNADDYKNEQYCRVRGNSFYIAFLGPGITVMLCNVIAFFLVVKSFCNPRVHSNRTQHGMVHFRRVLGITVVFGITWLFGVLAVGELRLIFQYLFCITNAFQGFMIFILYCLTDRKVREKLVRFLCVLQDPNPNRIIDSTTSTQRATDIDIDLSMFQERTPSDRHRNWSGTWPRTGHLTCLNPAWITQETTVAPGQIFPPRNDANRVMTFDDNIPYYYPYPSGSRPVPNIPLPGEPGGDKLVESTMSQYLEQSGGDKSLRSADGSIIFINNGQRVEVPKYTTFEMKEVSGSNNNWAESPTRMREIALDPSMMNESSFGESRRYSQGGDGLSFYKRASTRPRHSSATTSIEMSRRKTPTDRDYRKKGVHFSADELTISPDASDNLPRWSEMDWFPQIISHTHTLPEGTIHENEEFDGTSFSRGGHELHRIRSAKPSVAMTADDDVELDYYRRCQNDLGNEEDIASNYLAISESRKSRRMARSADKSPATGQSNTTFRQSSGSSSSETSSNASFRWSEAGHAPSLKSYSQTTFSDLNSDENVGPGNETHFTQF